MVFYIQLIKSDDVRLMIMKKITIKVSDLADMVKEMKKDKMVLAVITLEDPDTDGDPLPACLTFHATTDRDCPEIVDYGEIDAVDDLRL